jgi:hypothetical protein
MLKGDATSKQPPSGGLIFLAPEKVAQIQALLDRFDIQPDPTQFQRYTRGGKVFFRYRGGEVATAGGGVGGGEGSSGCTPWKPVFSEDAGTHYVRFQLGLLNQLVADNWDTPQAIGASAVKWPVLSVTASNGRITGYQIDLDDNPPDEDNIEEATPPATFKIVLGVIDSLQATMAVCTNLEAQAAEVFRESRNPPVEGAEPFSRWWRWTCNQWQEGSYPYIS